jgi:hypothetical protein
LDEGNSSLFKFRPGTFQRGDNLKNVKMWWGHLKILSLRTMGPEKADFYMKAF